MVLCLKEKRERRESKDSKDGDDKDEEMEEGEVKDDKKKKKKRDKKVQNRSKSSIIIRWTTLTDYIGKHTVSNKLNC